MLQSLLSSELTRRKFGLDAGFRLDISPCCPSYLTYFISFEPQIAQSCGWTSVRISKDCTNLSLMNQFSFDHPLWSGSNCTVGTGLLELVGNTSILLWGPSWTCNGCLKYYFFSGIKIWAELIYGPNRYKGLSCKYPYSRYWLIFGIAILENALLFLAVKAVKAGVLVLRVVTTIFLFTACITTILVPSINKKEYRNFTCITVCFLFLSRNLINPLAIWFHIHHAVLQNIN